MITNQKKCAFIFLILGLVFFLSCGKADKTGNEKESSMEETQKVKIKTELKDGVMYVYNPSQPLKGAVVPELEKILEIDSRSDPNVPSAFNMVVHDEDGNIYLANRNEVKIYKFSKEGKLITSFLSKGEGPGEFLRQIGNFEITGNDIWVSHARKIARYNRDGGFIGETKFDKSYTHIGIVDENRFIADYYEYSQEKKEVLSPLKRVCALNRKDQHVMVKFLEAENAGFTELRSPNRIQRMYDGSLTNDILHAYDHKQGIVYLFLTVDYKIILKNLTGETQMVIMREHQNKIIGDSDKEEILEHFKRTPEDFRKLLADNLPGIFCVITRIEFLPRGYIAVHRKTGFHKDEVDIFDKEGRFVYVLKTSEEIPDYIRFRFFKNKGVIIKNFEDRDVYVQYRIKNLPEIFGD